MMRHFRRLFAYDDWANREAVESLRMAAPSPRSLELMAHIVAAEWLWLSRLKQEKRAVVVWPELTRDQCAARVADLAPLWRDYLSALAPPTPSQRIEYTNTKGESWTNAVEDILTHVVMHSAYHRGQIATDLRASGNTPAYTDFIHCIRRGFVE